MTADERRTQQSLDNLSELCQHMTSEYGFSQEDFAKMTQGWVTNEDGLPVLIGPRQTYFMLATVARAIKFGLVVRPPRIIT